MPREAPQPPHNLEAEENVLGAMLISQSACEKALDILEGREFYRDTHREIFEAAKAVYERSAGVDVVTVLNELRDPAVRDHLTELSAMVPAASNVGHWAEIVRETWLARGLVRTGMELQKLGYEREGSIEELIGRADTAVLELSAHLERKRDTVFTGEQLVESYRYKMAHPEDENDGVPGPFPFIAPMKGSRLYVLGGYQADGKTALSLQFLRSACEAGKRVGFLSIEMGRSDLTDRLISTFGIPYQDVRLGRVAPERMEHLEHALKQIEAWDFEVIDDEQVDPASVRRTQRRGKYDLLIIDHLHRVPVNPRYQREELEAAVRKITNVAREFDVPILLLAQLSRGDMRDPFPRPTMSSLRGSGMIEAEAAMVWFVWRKRDKQQTPTTEAEFVIAKNRHGPLGWQHIWFQPTQVRFRWDNTGGDVS